MAGAHRGSPSHLEKDLLGKGSGYSFFQAFRLLMSRIHGERDSGGALRVKPDLSLGFPASDVVRIERSDDEDALRYTMTVSFLGLYGSSSPLPTFYTEDLLEEQSQDESVTREFLDCINQRFYELLFEAWRKYRQHLRVVEGQDAAAMERLFCLVGLGEQKLREELRSPYALIRYAGLFTQFPRSALGLKTLLRDALELSSLEIEQCVPRWVPIPEEQRSALGGRYAELGSNLHVGEKILDRMGKVRIHVGPLKKRQFQQLMPGMPKHELLVSLVRLYVSDALEFDLHLSMQPGEAQKTCLGGAQWSALGLDTWVYSRQAIGEVDVVFQPEALN
jgi:type VI secretion system protein ImpH